MLYHRRGFLLQLHHGCGIQPPTVALTTEYIERYVPLCNDFLHYWMKRLTPQIMEYHLGSAHKGFIYEIMLQVRRASSLTFPAIFMYGRHHFSSLLPILAVSMLISVYIILGEKPTKGGLLCYGARQRCIQWQWLVSLSRELVCVHNMIVLT